MTLKDLIRDHIFEAGRLAIEVINRILRSLFSHKFL